MKKQILKRIFSSISATTLAATSLGLNTVLAANAESTTPVAHVHEAEELTEAVSGHDDCHDECCDDHAHGGKGVTIALLDAGVTNSETAGKTSFIDDATIDSDHGNDMMNIISSVAPEADVLDVRVLDDEGKGTYSTVEKGIRWSVDNNADIIVMSFVGDKSSALLESALAYAEEHDVLVVASAGNYSSSTALYPAAYPTVVSVGAVDENGNVQDYSNFGDYVDTYVEWNDGTSGAAQYIAATAAVTMEQNPGITVSELRASYNTGKAPVEASKADNADTVVYSAKTCTHTFNGSFSISRNATCTTAGEKVGKCTKCGTVVTRVKIPALGHNWTSWSTTRNASCTSAAVQSHRCTRCGRTETRNYGSAYGHNYSWVVIKDSTCSATGTKQYKCSRCGYIAQTATIDKKSHTFNGSYNISRNATCTTAGEKVGKCTKCGTVVSRVAIPAYGHSWGSWSTTKNATCTAAGSKTHKCSRCGGSESASIPALGHNYSWVVIKDSTCSATGTKQYKCTRCGYVSKTATIDKKSHTFNGSFDISKNATCTTAGEKVGKCTKCGTVVTRTTIPALGHNWGSWTTTKNATCTAAGSKTHKCSRCSKSETSSIPALGHNYTWVVVKDSTCAATGTKQYKCTRCGHVSKTATIDKKSHTFNGSFQTTKQPTCTTPGEKVGKCTKCGTVVTKASIPATGHKWGNWVGIKNATCTTNGAKKHTCTVCKKTETATISATGHQFNGSFQITKQPTCTTPGEKVGKCTKCGAIITRVKIPAAHKWGAWTVTKQRTCTENGTKKRTCSACKKTETAAIAKLGGNHSFNGSYQTTKQPTCTTPGEKVGKCTRCGAVITRVKIPVVAHKWSAWRIIKQPTCTANGTKTRTCSVCKKTETASIGHPGHNFNGSYQTTKQPTCTTPGEKVGKCTRCGAVVSRVKIPAAHKWSGWTVTKQRTCTENGSKKRTCSACKKTETATIAKLGGNHSFNGSYQTTKQPTCTAAGEKVGKCTRCGAVITRVKIPATGHKWGKYTVIKKATCTVDGSQKHTCSVCKKTETVAIRHTGHTFNGSYTTTKQRTCTEDGEKVGKCTKCGTVVSRVKIPKLGGSHVFNGSYQITKKPTCKTPGEKVGKCTRCGAVVSRVKIPAEHTYGAWQQTKKPTCTDTGAKQRTCKICKYVQVQSIPKIGGSHQFNGSFTIVTNATCEKEGLKVGKCTKCGTVVTSVKIPKTGHKYVYDSKTLSMKCSVCGKSYVASSSTTWEDYVKKSGVNYSKLSKSDKEKFAKNYLISKGCDSTAVNISFEMGKNKKTLNVDNVDQLKKAMSNVDKFSKLSGFEYADNLSAFLGYAAVGADAYVFFTTADGSYANVEKTLTSYINLTSDIVDYIPVVGSAYSSVIGGLVDPLNDMIKRVKNYNDKTVEAILIEGDASDCISGFNGNYTDLADSTVYYDCIKYVDSMESHDYQYAKDLVDHYIYSGMDKDVKAATGKSIEEIKKMAK